MQLCRGKPQFARFHKIFQFTLFYGLPDLSLLSNIFTIVTLFRRRRRQERLSANTNSGMLEMRVNDVHSSRKQRQLTLMLVAVNLVFYSCSTPAVIEFLNRKHDAPPASTDREEKIRILRGYAAVLLQQIPNAVGRPWRFVFPLDDDLFSLLDEFYFLLSRRWTIPSGHTGNFPQLRQLFSILFPSISSWQ